jgi:hypothetical protein
MIQNKAKPKTLKRKFFTQPTPQKLQHVSHREETRSSPFALDSDRFPRALSDFFLKLSQQFFFVWVVFEKKIVDANPASQFHANHKSFNYIRCK